MIRKYKFTILTAILILILLLMPTSDFDDGTVSFWDMIPYFDKIVHLCMFGFISLVFASEKHLHKIKKYAVLNIVILVFFAVITEILQRLTGYRTFDVFDILADTSGIVIGTILMSKLFKIKWRVK